MNPPVHFVLSAGPLIPQYRRAIKTAAVHNAPLVLHYATEEEPDVTGLDVEIERVETPDWACDQHPAHLSDIMGYGIAHKYGGAVLPLDGISLRPVWDLFGDADMVVSSDAAPGVCSDPYNNVYLAQQGADVLLEMIEECERCVSEGRTSWGYSGPLLLTPLVDAGKIIPAPFPALCGWEGSYIWKFYLGVETPGEDVKMIHLFSGAYPELWQGRPQDWLRRHPDFIRWVPQLGVNPNASLLAF